MLLLNICNCRSVSMRTLVLAGGSFQLTFWRAVLWSGAHDEWGELRRKCEKGEKSREEGDGIKSGSRAGPKRKLKKRKRKNRGEREGSGKRGKPL